MSRPLLACLSGTQSYLGMQWLERTLGLGLCLSWTRPNAYTRDGQKCDPLWSWGLGA